MSVVRKVVLSNYERAYHQCLFGVFSRKCRASKLSFCASLFALACGTWGGCCGLLLPLLLQTGSSQVCEGANPPEHHQILPPSTTNYLLDFNLNVRASSRKMSRKICDWRVSESRQRERERAAHQHSQPASSSRARSKPASKPDASPKSFASSQPKQAAAMKAKSLESL